MRRSAFARYYTTIVLLLVGVLPLYGQWSTKATGLKPLTFAVINGISSPFAGSAYYCTDCTATSPCAGSGTGAFAYYTSAWNCGTGSSASSSAGDFTLGTNGLLKFGTVGSFGTTDGLTYTFSDVTDGTAVSFDLSSLGLGGHSITIPNVASGFLVTDTATQTLTNKTLTAPTLSDGVLVAATMTATTQGLVRSVINRYDWTNAMITTLGGVVVGDITICTLPAKTVVKRVLVVIDTPDTSANALTIAVGRVAASYTDYVVASDAKAAANTVYGDAISGAETGANLFDATAKWSPGDLPPITATIPVKAHFIKTTTNLSTVVGSTGHIYIETLLLP